MTDVLVLCYHAVSPSWSAPLSVTPDEFERQLSFLARRGWRATKFTEALFSPPAPRTLAITFDDAFQSVRQLAYPALRALGWPATVFAPTEFMGARAPLRWPGIDQWQGTADEHELISMNWEDLAELAEAGWEIGSHTCTHPLLTAVDDVRLKEELQRSRQECTERLGAPCESIAYPYGVVDERVAARAGEAGYRAAGTLISSLRPLGPLRWPRVGIYHVDDYRRFRLKMTPVMRHLRASSLWPTRE